MPEGGAHEIGGFLGKTTAGLPNWAWGLVIIGGAGVGYLFLRYQNAQAQPTATAETGQPGVPYSGPNQSPVVTVPTGSSGGQVPILPPGYTPLYDSQGNIVGWEPSGSNTPPPTQQPPPPPGGSKGGKGGKKGGGSDTDGSKTPIPPNSPGGAHHPNTGPGLPTGPQPKPQPKPSGGTQSSGGWVNPLVPYGTSIPATGGAFYTYQGKTYTIVPGAGGRIWGVPGQMSYQAAMQVPAKVLLMAPASYYH